MPVSQNQLVTMAPHHSLLSAHKWRSIAAVEATILSVTFSCGAPLPLGGMSSAESQQASAKAITSAPNRTASPPWREAIPAAIVPVRMAMKVAPSTSALPAGNSSCRKWSGRMPYLTGPNSAEMMPKPASATNMMTTEWRS